jgi:hypothetical protein
MRACSWPESGFAQRTEWRAFARLGRTIWHYRKRYAHGGMAALGRAGADQYLSGFSIHTVQRA